MRATLGLSLAACSRHALALSALLVLFVRHIQLLVRHLRPPRTRTVCAVRAACASRSTRRPLSAAALRSHRLRCSCCLYATLDSPPAVCSCPALVLPALLELVRHARLVARRLRCQPFCTRATRADRAACAPRSVCHPPPAAALHSRCLRCSCCLCAALDSSPAVCGCSALALSAPIALLVRHARLVARCPQLPCTRAARAARAACELRSACHPPPVAAPHSHCLRFSCCLCAMLGLSPATCGCPALALPALLVLLVRRARLVARRLRLLRPRAVCADRAARAPRSTCRSLPAAALHPRRPRCSRCL